ncbi:hypothetical protein JCM21900_003910 [Sporobolomyces salmonicolor]
MVDSADRRSPRYKTRGGNVRAAKLFPRWDGPYPVEAAFPASSTYRLTLLPSDRAHPVFHSSKLKCYHPNDPSLHAKREPPRPEPIDVDGEKEFVVEAIVDEKGKGARRRFLVKWEGYPDSDNTWEPLANVEDTAAMEIWEEGGLAKKVFAIGGGGGCKAKASPTIGSRRMGTGGAGNGNREQENGSGSGPGVEQEWSGGASGDKLNEW